MRLLLVEDHVPLADELLAGLTRQGYAVDWLADGRDAAYQGATEPYDLIILDLLLPEMDGVTLCKQLRKNKIHTPVLMLTAKGQIQDKVEGLDSGADDYLTKPFSFEELLARIRALSRRPKTALNEVLAVEDLQLNTKLYKVERGGKRIKLTSKEFSLLEYLMRNANKILSKDQIIVHVWNYDAEILPNTVEVYIKNLRKKIDVSFKNLPAGRQTKKPLIHTVRGFGYKIGV